MFKHKMSLGQLFQLPTLQALEWHGKGWEGVGKGSNWWFVLRGQDIKHHAICETVLSQEKNVPPVLTVPPLIQELGQELKRALSLILIKCSRKKDSRKPVPHRHILPGKDKAESGAETLCP